MAPACSPRVAGTMSTAGRFDPARTRSGNSARARSSTRPVVVASSTPPEGVDFREEIPAGELSLMAACAAVRLELRVSDLLAELVAEDLVLRDFVRGQIEEIEPRIDIATRTVQRSLTG